MGNALSPQKVASILGRVPLFSVATQDAIEALAGLVEIQSVENGAIIAEAGGMCKECYIVASGVVASIVTHRITKKMSILEQKGPMETFGELGLVNSFVWTTTMKALAPTTLLVVTATAFETVASRFAVTMSTLSALNEDTVSKQLAGIPFFAGCDDNTRSVLGTLFQVVMSPARSVLCREGAPSDSFCIIAKGSVQVTIAGHPAAFRDVRARGCLTKEGGSIKSWKRRFFMLHNNQLCWYQHDEAEVISDSGPRRRSTMNGRGPRFSIASDANIRADPEDNTIVSIIGRDVDVSDYDPKRTVTMTAVQPSLDVTNGIDVSTAEGRVVKIHADSTIHRDEWLSCMKAGIAAAAESGELKVPEEGPAPVRITLRQGSYFGEVSLVSDMPRTATVIANEPTVLLVLPKTNFSRFLETMPEIKESVAMSVKQRSAARLRTLELPFLSGLTESQMELVATLSRLRQFAAGDIVFNQGDEGTSFFIILHGDMIVSIKGDDGTSTDVNHLTTGHYFGEIALLTDEPRLATIRAGTNSTVLELSKTEFLSLFANEAPEALADFELRLLREKAELMHIIRHPVGLKFFRTALEREFSAENIHFWEAANVYRRKYTGAGELSQPLKAKQAEEAQALYVKYVGDSAQEQINIKSVVRARIEEKLQTGAVDADIFVEAQAEIYKLIQADNYARFKASPDFAELMATINTYKGHHLSQSAASKELARRASNRIRAVVTGTPASTTPGTPSTLTQRSVSSNSAASGAASP